MVKIRVVMMFVLTAWDQSRDQDQSNDILNTFQIVIDRESLSFLKSSMTPWAQQDSTVFHCWCAKAANASSACERARSSL